MPIQHVKNITVADGGNTDIVRPSDWNSAHAYTLQDAVSLGGNTAGAMANISSGTLHLAGGNNITLSQNGNSVTISGGGVLGRSYENNGPGGFVTQTYNGASISGACAFRVPEDGSFSFLRIFCVMTNTSTTLATTAASMSASVQFRSTWNVVAYTAGTGASSDSLYSVASGSGAVTFMNSVSIATNGTRGSYTQAFTGLVEGGSTTLSTQYSVSATNYPFSSTYWTRISGNRMLDIPFNNSLPARAYWLIIGYSSSTATNSTGISAASNCNIRYSNHFGQTILNSNFGVMGSTNLTSGGYLGAGSFSTAGGGTVSALPRSAISSSASHNRLYFQMLRSN